MEAKTKGMGKLKALIGAVAGLLSGAVIMYVSPLVDKVVKPGSPIANFEARQDGLAVSFHNLSTGARSLEGWWDFGDGSPLVPLVGDEDVSHSYPRPGGYTAKLTVRNLLGDANERTVTLQLEAGGAAETPKILSLDAASLAPEALAPATFKVASEIRNASLAVWDLAEGRPLEVMPTPSGRQERLVTFEKPGNHVIKLAAFNGQQHEEKLVQVSVKAAPAGALTAVLSVNDQATEVKQVERPYNFSASFPPDQKDNTYSFELHVAAPTGWSIADVSVQGQAMQGKPTMTLDATALKAAQVRNLQLQRDPDGKKVHLTGELTRKSNKDRTPMLLPVVLREERRQRASRDALPVLAALPMPGTTSLMMPPLPQGWETPKRAFRLELRDGNRVLWQGTQLPKGEQVSVKNCRCLLTASQSGDRVQLNLTEQR